MLNRNVHDRRNVTRAARVAAPRDERASEALDVVTTAGALVACADGRVAPAERDALVNFMDRYGFLSIFTRREILAAFRRRLRQFERYSAAKAAVDRLGRFAGRWPARLAIAAGREVATADGYLHDREIRFLQLIHIALGAPSSRSLHHVGRVR
ncbi:tellurite resistance TerB family protein [Methylocapsa sp. S129]|uniref:tellurite resistance TerB family protein n=1 Tax=Methylocapsa sp. S129 TaxID=1641869 RepID=UPI00131BD2AE|nr:tellurite resistance TerB family protein [Methylocapsa sp. S129]